ncbi:MAG: type II toxin-antitoxin system mRNA interferase toxin, RelE/StbE family [Aeriscardovia sp.]|nr:type II toxin-antitoxin system mRNA interferase toxin, RelE/StbE family [Aeriscardovia sp.]
MLLETAGKDHALKGEFNGLRECHVRSDWLLV